MFHLANYRVVSALVGPCLLPGNIFFLTQPDHPLIHGLSATQFCKKYIILDIGKCAGLKWMIKSQRYKTVLNWEVLTLTWRETCCYKFLSIPGSNSDRGSVVPMS